MKTSRNILFIFLLIGSLKINAQTLDQAQLNNNAQMSARRLQGYSLFQSFTAGITGTLTQIDLSFIDSLNAIGSIRLYSGADTTGGLLQVAPVTVTCAGAPCWANFMVSLPVVSGQQYTFRFIPGQGMTDPYFMQSESPGTYAGGRLGFINPYIMGFFPTERDLVFRTYVQVGATGITGAAPDASSFKVFPNPAHGNVTISWKADNTGKILLVTDAAGRNILQIKIEAGEKSMEISDLPKGFYLLSLKHADQRLIAEQKVIVE